MKRVILALLLGLSACVMAQTKKNTKPVTPVDLNSPAWKAYDTKQNALRKQMAAALDAESTREKEDECRNLQSENEKRECLSRETETTQKNYEVYTKALTARLRVRQPVDDPLERLQPPRGRKFDAAERAWVLYRNSTCSALGEAYYGGNIQGQVETSCLQDLTRRHLHELDSLYRDE